MYTIPGKMGLSITHGGTLRVSSVAMPRTRAFQSEGVSVSATTINEISSENAKHKFHF